MSRLVFLAMFDNCDVRRAALAQELHKTGRYRVIFHRQVDPDIAAAMSYTVLDCVLLAVGENAQNEQDVIDILRCMLGTRPVLAYALKSISQGFFQRFIQQRRLGVGLANCQHQDCFAPHVDTDKFVRALDMMLFCRTFDDRTKLDSTKPVSAPGDFPQQERKMTVCEHAAPYPAVLDELSFRERQILGLLGDGHSFKEIAAELGISINTVYTHAKRIRARRQLTGNAQLLAFAIRAKLSGASGDKRV